MFNILLLLIVKNNEMWMPGVGGLMLEIGIRYWMLVAGYWLLTNHYYIYIWQYPERTNNSKPETLSPKTNYKILPILTQILQV